MSTADEKREIKRLNKIMEKKGAKSRYIDSKMEGDFGYNDDTQLADREMPSMDDIPKPLQDIAFIAPTHGTPQLVKHQPGRPVTHADLLGHRERRDTLLALGQLVDRPEPFPERNPRPVEHRPGRHARLAVTLATFHEPPVRQPPASGVAAVRAGEPLQARPPADVPQMLPAPLVRSEPLSERADVHHRR